VLTAQVYVNDYSKSRHIWRKNINDGKKLLVLLGELEKVEKQMSLQQIM
jgi:hypothetical protein